MPELAPPPATTPRLNLLLGLALLILPLALAAPILSNPNEVFAFNDGNIEVALSPTHAYPQSMLRMWDNQFFFGGSSGTASLNSPSLLESLMGPKGYRTWGVPLAVWMVGLCGFWCARRLHLSTPAAWLTGLLLTLCGWSFSFATVGLPVRTFTLGWSLLSLGMLVTARERGSLPRYAIAGGFLGFAVSDTPDVGIFFALSLAACFVVMHLTGRKDWRPAGLCRDAAALGLYILASLLIAWQVIITMYGANIATPTQAAPTETPEQTYAWATQWSLPPAETWSLIAPDFHGASSRSERSPYWGRMGQTAGWEQHQQGFRNFRLAGYAIGATAVVLLPLLWALLCSPSVRNTLDPNTRRMAWLLTALAAVALMLAWGRHFPLYRAFFALPFMTTIRNPDKWLGPFTLAITLLFGLAVEAVIRLRTRPANDTRRLLPVWLAAVGALITIALAGTLYLSVTRGLFSNRLTAMGYGVAGSPTLTAIHRNALGANITFIILALLTTASGLLYLRRRALPPRTATLGLTLALAATLTFDLWRAATPFVLPARFKHLDAPNPLTTFLDAHHLEGRLKLLPPQDPILNNWRLTYLMARGYDLFDPVSIRQMPGDYATLFGSFNAQIGRLWQLGGLRFFLCPAEVARQLPSVAPPGTAFIERAAFGAIERDRLAIPSDAVAPEQQGFRIVEFTGALPLCRLVPRWSTLPDTAAGWQEAMTQLARPEFPLDQEAIVHGDLTPSRREPPPQGHLRILSHAPATTTLAAELQGEMLLVRAVKYDPAWRVTIDGESQPLLRVNAMFQGVLVPAGAREIAFAYRPSRLPLVFAASTRLLFLTALLGLAAGRRRTRTPAAL